MNSYLNPYTSSNRWLRGNIHAHTCCGRFMDIAMSGAMYRSLGYDFLAVTDHDLCHDEAYIEDRSRQSGILIIPGVENGQTDHIIELGAHELAQMPSDDYLERAQTLKARGGFVMGCHPQEYAVDRRGERNIERSWPALHAVEIYNGLREARGTDELLNIALWDRILTEGGRLWGVATDDFHCQYIGPGRGWVQVQVPEDAEVTWQLIVEQMKKGAFYSTTYPLFERIYYEEDVLSVTADRLTQVLRIIGPGGKTLTEVNGQSLDWRVTPGLAYFRIEAVSGIKRAWSQPFYRA